jgi:murein L,D-transpeptidase YcbB/YkuD
MSASARPTTILLNAASKAARLRIGGMAPSLCLAATLSLGLVAGCRALGKKAKYAPQSVTKVLSVPAESLTPAIAKDIGSEDRPKWVTADRWKRVRAIYTSFENAPIWLEEGGVKDRAAALLEALRTAPDHGLDTAAYPVSEIAALVNEKRLTDTASAATLAHADVMLTSAYVAYAADMLVGQVDPASVSQAWHIPSVPSELDSAIVHGLENEDMKASLAAMAPQDPDYAALKDAYARYRDIAAKGDWPMTTTAGAALQSRLAMELTADSTRSETRGADSVNTAPAAAAPTKKHPTPPSSLLAQFQERHGFARTGKLDKSTIAALNITAADRAKQIAANLERHRWLPRTLGSRYVYVNVPAFRLDAYDSGQKTLSMKVVVGDEYEGKNTPVFSDSMESVVFRPYWNITPDIQAKEIGPKAAADPSYLDRENMEYYKDGNARRIRQKPGGKNSLGLVKFLFPNNFNIYLHDTPAKALFAQTDRARVDAAMNGGEDNHPVGVKPKIPVYIVYFTSYIRDGQLYWGSDVYNRDDRLEQKVADAPLKAAGT